MGGLLVSLKNYFGVSFVMNHSDYNFFFFLLLNNEKYSERKTSHFGHSQLIIPFVKNFWGRNNILEYSFNGNLEFTS